MKEVTVSMETTTCNTATAKAAAFRIAAPVSGVVRTGFSASLALLPQPKLNITGYVRPMTAAFTVDEHNVRTWSPPV